MHFSCTIMGSHGSVGCWELLNPSLRQV